MFLVSVEVKNVLEVFHWFPTQDGLKQQEKLFLDRLSQQEPFFDTKSYMWDSKYVGTCSQSSDELSLVHVSDTIFLFLSHVDSCARAIFGKDCIT